MIGATDPADGIRARSPGRTMPVSADTGRCRSCSRARPIAERPSAPVMPLNDLAAASQSARSSRRRPSSSVSRASPAPEDAACDAQDVDRDGAPIGQDLHSPHVARAGPAQIETHYPGDRHATRSHASPDRARWNLPLHLTISCLERSCRSASGAGREKSGARLRFEADVIPVHRDHRNALDWIWLEADCNFFAASA